jgi:hypothetical protein
LLYNIYMKTAFTERDKKEIQVTILKIKKYSLRRAELMELDDFEGEYIDPDIYKLMLLVANTMNDLIENKHYPQNFILLKLYDALIYMDIQTIREHIKDYKKILSRK